MTKVKVSTHLNKNNGLLYAFIPSLGVVAKVNRQIEYMDINESEMRHYHDQLVERRRIVGMSAELTSVHIIPTGECHGGCSYCYAMDAWKDVKYISADTIKKSLKLNNVTNPESFHIYGGEPLTNLDEFIGIVNYISNAYPGVQIAISTGLMIDEPEFERFLKWLSFDAPDGFWCSCSIDAYDPIKPYTRRRWGNNTYNILMDRIKIVRSVTKNMGIRVTVSMNGHNPFPMMKEMREYFGELIPTGMELVDNPGFELTKGQMQSLKTSVKEWVEDVLLPTGNMDSGDENTHNWRTFQPFNKVFMYNDVTYDGRACPAGHSGLTINTDGGVDGCSRIVKLGLEKDYSKIRESQVKKYTSTEGIPCDRCDYFASCAGGCAESMRLNYSGSDSEPISCDWRRFIIDYSMEIFLENSPVTSLEQIISRNADMSKAISKMTEL